MKILIILPNWLGDAIMSTPTIEALAKHYPKAEFTFIGSYVAIEALKYHPLCYQAIVDETKKSRSRLLATIKLAKGLPQFDLALTFRKNIYASLLVRFTKTAIRVGRKTWFNKILLTRNITFIKDRHLVLNYFEFIRNLIPEKISADVLKLHIPKESFQKPSLGINPGATYGSAKRWYPKEFAKVAQHFAKDYQIVIFGGPTEVKMGEEIAQELDRLDVKQYTNLAGKTSIKELCSHIGGCDLFLTNDSGPMHIAAAYAVPTVAIFGPTKHTETSQWKNKKSEIVRLDMDCAPCMRRVCPLGHHECMKNISADMVIDAMKKIV